MTITNGKIIKGFLPINIATGISKFCINNKVDLLERWEEIYLGRIE